MNMVRCLLTEKEMPKTLWAEAAKWTNHVINRSLTKASKENGTRRNFEWTET